MGKHTLKEWVIATRPWSFPASAMPVIVTCVYLYGTHTGINWLNGLWALVNIIVFHAAGNTWSDYWDYCKGVDTSDTYGAKTLTGGQFTAKEIRCLSFWLLGMAMTLGIGLLLRTGWILLGIGIGGILCTLLYPWLKYRAWGDVVIFLAYALLPTWGTSYVLTGVVDMQVLWLAVPVGLITVAILHANNTRDVKTDRQACIKTLAMQTGNTVAKHIYAAEVLLPFLWIAVGVATGHFAWWSLLTLIVLPLAVGNVRMIWASADGNTEEIAHLDEKTAQLQLVFSLVLSVTFLLTIWV
ncbi:MAG: prenyltransferase [Odoribacter sp.]|nr:prenyltransferase [Odoribacter sp.]